MKHRASCQCSAISVASDTDPDLSVICCCSACQRRTGSAFGVGVYFPINDVSISGRTRIWTRSAESGRSLTNHFCPGCGTTVYWTLDMRPQHLGVALGCLQTPSDDPRYVVWAQTARGWLRFPDQCPVHTGPAPGH